MVDCMDCKHCEIWDDKGGADCLKRSGVTLKVSTTTYDCDSDGRKPHGGPFEVVTWVGPDGDDCEVGEE